MGVEVITDNFVDRVGAEGFYDIKRHNDFACRVFWVVLVVIAWILAFYQCAVYIIKFLEYQKTTTYELQYSSHMQFPAVTFCNLNPIRISEKAMFQDSDNQTLIQHLSAEPPSRAKRQAPPPADGNKTLSPTIQHTNTIYSNVERLATYKNNWEKLAPDYAGGVGAPRTAPADNAVEDNYVYYETEAALASNDELVTEVKIQQNFYSELYKQPPHKKIEAGHSIYDMIVECVWRQTQCSPSDFASFFHPTHGNCYTFNAGWMNYSESNQSYIKSVKNTSSTGPEHGLTLILYSQSEEYIPAIASSNGFKIVIHHQKEIPYPDSAGYIASAGYYNAYKLKLTELTRLSTPYNPNGCGAGVGYPMESAKDMWPTASYSQAACMNFLMQRSLVDNCSCIVANIWIQEGKVPCDNSNKTQYNCGVRVMEQFSDATGTFVTNNCPPSCNEADFEITTSIASWPSLSYVKFLNSSYADRHQELADLFVDVAANEALETVRQNVAKVDVFYDKLSFSTITESPEYPFTQMLGDVGGAVGLWAGVSILSMIQICEFVMELCKYNCKGKDETIEIEQTRRGPDRPATVRPEGREKDEALPTAFL